MPVIFQAPAGAAIPMNPIAISSSKSASTLFSLGSGAPSQHAITTGVSYSQKVAAQFKQSLRRVLFVYPFGDEPSQMAVTLSMFLKDCEGNLLTGVDDVLKYYDTIKLKPNAADPIDVVIGGSPVKAFCIGMDLSMQVIGLQTVSTIKFNLIGWNLNGVT